MASNTPLNLPSSELVCLDLCGQASSLLMARHLLLRGNNHEEHSIEQEIVIDFTTLPASVVQSKEQ